MDDSETPWEYGSFFHAISVPRADASVDLPWRSLPHLYASSGRGALLHALSHHEAAAPGARVWFPTYYCPEVIDAVREAGYAVAGYPDLPTTAADAPVDAAFASGDFIVTTNHFGLRRPRVVPHPDCHVMEDHTHDPQSDWARESLAEFAFASLRKSLPTVDGAILWSPTGSTLAPLPPPSGLRTVYWQRGQVAMQAKAAYLGGGGGDKDTFLAELRAVETLIGASPVGRMDDVARDEILTLLQSDWRTRRTSLWAHFQEALGEVPGVTLAPPAEPGSIPFNALLLFESRACRDYIRSQLIARSVYPAILWDLGVSGWDQQSPAAAEWSGRSLSLPIDARYSHDDAQRVCEILRDALGEFSA